MSKTPWILTREMFLDEQELVRLLKSLARAVSSSTRAEKDTAILDQVIIASLALSGLRNSEFCHLTLAEADVGSQAPGVQITGARGEDRVVSIPRSLASLLRHYINGPRQRFLPEHVDAKDNRQPLILTERKRPSDRTTLYRRVVKIFSAHALGDRASVQFLRHTYGYLAYKRSGGNLLFVQRQLDHAHPMVTAIYEQFVSHDYASIADRLSPDSFLSESEQPHSLQELRERTR